MRRAGPAADEAAAHRGACQMHAEAFSSWEKLVEFAPATRLMHAGPLERDVRRTPLGRERGEDEWRSDVPGV